MTKRIALALCLAGAFALAAHASAAEQTRILGVEFSQDDARECLSVRIEGPAPDYDGRARRNEMSALVRFENTDLAGGGLRIPLTRSQFLKSVHLEQVDGDTGPAVLMSLRFDRWATFRIVQKDDRLELVLDRPFPAPPLSAATSDSAQVVQGNEARVLAEVAGDADQDIAPAARTDVYVPEAVGDSGALRVDKAEDFGLVGGEYDKIVSLDFRHQRVEDVIRLIAAKGEINILFDPGEVQGEREITLHLANVKLGVALDQILRISSLGFVREEGNILRIVPASRVGIRDVEVDTEVIPLNWVKGDKLVESLRPFISNDGQIQSNAETNSIVVTDTPPNLEMIRELVAELDIPEKQVMVEMHLVDIGEAFKKQHGISWDLFPIDTEDLIEEIDIPGGLIPDPDNPGQFIPDPLNPAQIIQNVIGKQYVPSFNKLNPAGVPFGTTALDNLGFGAPIAGATTALGFGKPVGIFGDQYWLDASIQADAQREYAQVLANPRVITLNNMPATIRLEEQIPYMTGIIGPSGSISTVIAFRQAGERIEVTPTITANGYVRMEIEVLQQIFRGRVDTGPYDAPKIDEREAQTNVIVRDGATIALGGLEGHRTLELEKGTPWLMDVPVFRWFFKSDSKDMVKTTLYLFVRPKIVPVDASELTEREKFWFDGVDRNWNVPDEYFDDWGSFFSDSR
jgi:type IV pilus assembly protein PilQ